MPAFPAAQALVLRPGCEPFAAAEALAWTLVVEDAAAGRQHELFGLVEIDWEAEGGPVLAMTAIDIEGRAAFELSVPLAYLNARGGAAAAADRSDGS